MLLLIGIMFEMMIFDSRIWRKKVVLPGKIPEYRGKCTKRPEMERKNHRSKGKNVYDAIPGHYKLKNIDGGPYKLKNIDGGPRLIYIFFLGFVAILQHSGGKFFNQISGRQKNLTEIFLWENCSALRN